jgi:D-serine deaminase-like pyridoxal phosphate-dependent protein
VQSLPDPGVAILTFGKRSSAYDIELPVALDLPGAVVTTINDQHPYLSYPAEAYPADVNLAVGMKLRFGISHPCMHSISGDAFLWLTMNTTSLTSIALSSEGRIQTIG